MLLCTILLLPPVSSSSKYGRQRCSLLLYSVFMGKSEKNTMSQFQQLFFFSFIQPEQNFIGFNLAKNECTFNKIRLFLILSPMVFIFTFYRCSRMFKMLGLEDFTNTHLQVRQSACKMNRSFAVH